MITEREPEPTRVAAINSLPDPGDWNATQKGMRGRQLRPGMELEKGEGLFASARKDKIARKGYI
jgi:hypothetical protein